MEAADLVLEGGGVKGAGLAGAVSRVTERYEVHRIAGTSAGAIVAALVAAGLEDRFEELTICTDFAQFLDAGTAGRFLGGLGRGLDLAIHEGLYRGIALHRWIADALAEAGVRIWGDLRMPGADAHTPMEQRYRLVVIVSDISRGRMLRLPWDVEALLGTDPDLLPVADAVRASASIPFFFRPWRLPVDPALAQGNTGLVLTDGGMLSNYPIGLFDDEMQRPTIGVKLSRRMSVVQSPWRDVDDPFSLAKGLVATMTNAHDQIFVDQPSVASRTIFVDTGSVSAVDFELSSDARRELYERGSRAAEAFFEGWDYARWRTEYDETALVVA